VRTFKIPESRLDGLRSKLDALVKRAAKLGAGAISYTVGEQVMERVPDPDGTQIAPRYRAYYMVEIAGEAPKLAGWTFVATVDHFLDEVGAEWINTIRAPHQTAVDLARYRAAPPNCDQCHRTIRRISTYVLQHEDGRVAQVGSTCLADFLGHPDPAALAASFELLLQAVALGEEGEDFSGGGTSYVGLQSYLTYVALAVRLGGWVSRKVARDSADLKTASADVADSLMFSKDPRDPRPGDEDREMAEKALEWAGQFAARAQTAPDSLTDYEWNVATVVRLGVIEQRTMGVAASIIGGYKRSLNEARQHAERAASVFFGTEKERIVLKNIWLDAVFPCEGMYGTTYIHRFRTAEGNLAVWFSSSGSLREHRAYELKATIKGHAVRRYTPRNGETAEEKQTLITRCKVLAEHEPATDCMKAG
jgi:hypothetical protein